MDNRDLNYFWKNCKERKLCIDYALKWRKCKSKEQLVNFALKTQSAIFFANAIYHGWGLSIGYIKNEFSDYINGKYYGVNVDGIEQLTDYRSAFYCEYNDEIIKDVDSIHLIKCNCELTVPLERSGIIYISNSSNITLYLKDYSCPIIYLMDESKLTLEADTENCDVLIFKLSDKCSIKKIKTSGKYLIERKEIQL